MAYQFMKKNQDRYTITKMSKLFGVSRDAFYKWQNGHLAPRCTKDAEMIRLIREIQIHHHFRYGSPRIKKELLQVYGKRVNIKKIARLLRENNLNARRRRKFIPTTNSNHGFAVCDNILNRQFSACFPGEKWVSDITYLRTSCGWVYLTVVLDLFDRKVIGWALSTNMETVNTSIPALQMAFKNRKAPNGLIFHSDQGVQYCSKEFRQNLETFCPTVRQSMSRKGNCWDNACAESFFKTLKTELETLDGKHSASDVRTSVFMYIEAYYNRIRLHSALDYYAPNMICLPNTA